MKNEGKERDKIEELLKSAGANPGDTIAIEEKSRSISIEGELMPKTENNAPDVIVVKLHNGYNIGIKYSEDMKIKKLKSGTIPAFPETVINTKGKPRIGLIYTGGTIGSKIDYKTGGVYMLLKPGELIHEVPEIGGVAEIEVKNLFSIASEDMSYIEWQKIAESVAEMLNRGKRGVVVTTGTDTMHYIASALSFMLQNLNAPVVLTGAQRSSDRGSSDAFLNLSCAVELATHSDIAEVGICMHATSSDTGCAFIRGTRARKMHTSRRDAFRPINSKPIAYIGEDFKISYMSEYKKIESSSKKVVAMTGFERKVALVKAYPNSDPGIIDYYQSKGYKGIIIEGTGLGHTPVSIEHEGYSWLPTIKEAIEKGMVIGMTSQCIYGRVNPNVYRNLRLLSNAGVVYCEDMLPETAYVKLGWLLGNYEKEQAKKLLNKNIAGEISSRSGYDEFMI
ncbi:MAG: Glu-tRNA(Gln) amidotransferase subunit GatD [Candidatus Micrarchaeia archaeon]